MRIGHEYSNPPIEKIDTEEIQFFDLWVYDHIKYLPKFKEQALNKEYTLPILIDPEKEDWILPPGAFGESCGPS